MGMLIVLPLLVFIAAIILMWMIFIMFADNINNTLHREKNRFKRTNKKIKEMNEYYDEDEKKIL